MRVCVHCSLPHILPPINQNYNNEFNWVFKPAAISELYSWARLLPACCVNAWDVTIIMHPPPTSAAKHTLTFACILACNRVIKMTVSSPGVTRLAFSLTELQSQENFSLWPPLTVLGPYQCYPPLLMDTNTIHLHACSFRPSVILVSLNVWLEADLSRSLWPNGLPVDWEGHMFAPGEPASLLLQPVTGYTKDLPSEASAADRLCC